MFNGRESCQVKGEIVGVIDLESRLNKIDLDFNGRSSWSRLTKYLTIKKFKWIMVDRTLGS